MGGRHLAGPAARGSLDQEGGRGTCLPPQELTVKGKGTRERLRAVGAPVPTWASVSAQTRALELQQGLCGTPHAPGGATRAAVTAQAQEPPHPTCTGPRAGQHATSLPATGRSGTASSRRVQGSRTPRRGRPSTFPPLAGPQVHAHRRVRVSGPHRRTDALHPPLTVPAGPARSPQTHCSEEGSKASQRSGRHARTRDQRPARTRCLAWGPFWGTATLTERFAVDTRLSVQHPPSTKPGSRGNPAMKLAITSKTAAL